VDRVSDEEEEQAPMSPRILAQLGLSPGAGEDDILAAIEKLQAELAATRPRLATELPMRVRYWRKRAGLKSGELARKMGLSPTTVSTWESGRSAPDHETLERVCSFCGITLVTFWSPLPDERGGVSGDSPPPAKQAASG
jgi:DNA-binding XRE family transcriptional regulator